MSRVVHKVVGRRRRCTPTLPRTRTNQCGCGMRVRHESATCGTGGVRFSILHVSRIPRQSMCQPTRAQTIHSIVHLTCNAKQLKQQVNLRIKSDMQINEPRGGSSHFYVPWRLATDWRRHKTLWASPRPPPWRKSTSWDAPSVCSGEVSWTG